MFLDFRIVHALFQQLSSMFWKEISLIILMLTKKSIFGHVFITRPSFLNLQNHCQFCSLNGRFEMIKIHDNETILESWPWISKRIKRYFDNKIRQMFSQYYQNLKHQESVQQNSHQQICFITTYYKQLNVFLLFMLYSTFKGLIIGRFHNENYLDKLT